MIAQPVTAMAWHTLPLLLGLGTGKYDSIGRVIGRTVFCL